MPLYDYRCRKCGHQEERFYPMDRSPRRVKCQCGARAIKVCSAGGWQDQYGRAGGIRDDHPVWLAGAVDTAQDDQHVKCKTEAPIESRSQLRAYMKEKGLAFGDDCPKAVRPSPDHTITPELRKQGIEAVKRARHESRSITIY